MLAQAKLLAPMVDQKGALSRVEAPRGLSLASNYPNPFNPSAQISYALPEASRVRLTINDVTGRQVSSLVNQEQEAGRHTVQFEAGDLASGS